jgi:hypothetical protein
MPNQFYNTLRDYVTRPILVATTILPLLISMYCNTQKISNHKEGTFFSTKHNGIFDSAYVVVHNVFQDSLGNVVKDDTIDIMNRRLEKTIPAKDTEWIRRSWSSPGEKLEFIP